MSVSKQRRYRQRSPEKPVLGMLADRYSEWYLEFCPTGRTTRSELAEVFFEMASESARDYVDIEEASRPAPWNDYTRDPESLTWMNKHYDERTAWAKSIDLLWQFSDGEDVDADALREALTRMSLRRDRAGSRRDRNEALVFGRASDIVRDMAGLDELPDNRFEAIRRDYR